jgi:hypothetical protein
MANWWEAEGTPVQTAPVSPVAAAPQPTATPNEWWKTEGTPVQAAPTTPGPAGNPNGFNPNPDDNLQNDLNSMRDDQVNAPDAPTPAVTPHDPNKPYTANEMYTAPGKPGDPNNPKYQELTDYENNLSHHLPVLRTSKQDGTLGAEYSFGGQMPQNLVDLTNQRSKEAQDIYNSTGDEHTVPDYVPIVGGQTYRTQDVRVPNPRYNPNHPGGHPDANGEAPTVDSRYLVPPPESDTIHRLGYNILRNIATGTVDFATQGKLLTEGKAGQTFPSMPTDGTGEDLGTTVMTLALGPKALGSAYTQVAKNLPMLGRTGQAVATMANSFTPTEISRLSEGYDYLKKTAATAPTALQSTSLLAKKLIGGLALITAQAATAPDNMQGLISPETVQKYTPVKISHETAQDLSFALDSPIISMGLATVGGAIAGAGKAISGTFGALGEMVPVAQKAMNVVTINGYQRGLKIMTSIDPDLLTQGPKEAAVNIKLMSDLLAKNNISYHTLGTTSGENVLDTATAFGKIAQEYFSKSYGYKQAYMRPDEFQGWVTQKATAATNELMQIRTSLKGEANQVAATGANQLDQLGAKAADEFGGGNLEATRGQAAQNAFETQDARVQQHNNDLSAGAQEHDSNINRIQTNFDTAMKQNAEAKAGIGRERDTAQLEADRKDRVFQLNHAAATEEAAKQKAAFDDQHQVFKDNTEAQQAANNQAVTRAEEEAANAKERASRAISNDPEIRKQADEILSDNPWHSATEGERIQRMADPMYSAFSTMKKGVNEAYNRLGDSSAQAAQGDGNKILQTIHDSGLQDPILDKIAESVNKNDSFGNIFNNVKGMINAKLNTLNYQANPELYGVLKQLKTNATEDQITHLLSNGDGDVANMAKDANSKFQDFYSHWKDYNPMKEISKSASERLAKEHLPFDQGGRNFNDTFSKVVKSNLNNDDQGTFIKSMSDAAKAGGQNIDQDMIHSLSAKALDNLLQTLDRGSVENVQTLRTALNTSINGLKTMAPDHPLLKQWEQLRNQVETLGALSDESASTATKLKANTAVSNTQLSNDITSSKRNIEASKSTVNSNLKDTTDQIEQDRFNNKEGLKTTVADLKNKSGQIDAKAETDKAIHEDQTTWANKKFDEIKQKAAELKQMTDHSMLEKFVHDSNVGKRAIKSGETQDTIHGIFRGKESTSNLEDLIREADDMNKKSPGTGDTIKQALQGEYINYVFNKSKGASSMGVVSMSPNAEMSTVNRTNRNKAMKLLEGKDEENLDVLFPNNPEVKQQLHDIIHERANLTMTTPQSGNVDALLRVTKAEDPRQAIGSTITLTYGNLSREATRLRRLSEPTAAKALKDVQERKAGELEGAMAYPNQMAEIGRKTAKGIEHKEKQKEAIKDAARGVSRYNSNATSDWYNQLNTGTGNIANEMKSALGIGNSNDQNNQDDK